MSTPAILLHSSKTMRSPAPTRTPTTPALLAMARPLGTYVRTLDQLRLQAAMQVSAPLAAKVAVTWSAWNTEVGQQSLAIDSFIGDIYSGLQAGELTTADRDYAQRSLYILSGLYGMLRPYDGIRPYRLEMGYRLPDEPYRNLYAYWGEHIAATLPAKGLVINLSALEYTKTVLPSIDPSRLVTPRFLTINSKTGQAGQVVVHTKIARGAFARWLLCSRLGRLDQLSQFADLGYRYAPDRSTPREPTFVCQAFGGLGLSVRLR